ncbi:MAG: hypothetical protein GY830_11390 [Bacteroidetes bacterium]|nr:hypothetical protein [Bacteroidota bacterium]
MVKLPHYLIFIIFVNCNNGYNKRCMMQSRHEEKYNEDEEIEEVKILMNKKNDFNSNNGSLNNQINNLNSKIERDRYEEKQRNERINQLQKELNELNNVLCSYKTNKSRHQSSLKNISYKLKNNKKSIARRDKDIKNNEKEISKIRDEKNIDQINLKQKRHVIYCSNSYISRERDIEKETREKLEEQNKSRYNLVSDKKNKNSELRRLESEKQRLLNSINIYNGDDESLKREISRCQNSIESNQKSKNYYNDEYNDLLNKKIQLQLNANKKKNEIATKAQRECTSKINNNKNKDENYNIRYIYHRSYTWFGPVTWNHKSWTEKRETLKYRIITSCSSKMKNGSLEFNYDSDPNGKGDWSRYSKEIFNIQNEAIKKVQQVGQEINNIERRINKLNSQINCSRDRNNNYRKKQETLRKIIQINNQIKPLTSKLSNNQSQINDKNKDIECNNSKIETQLSNIENEERRLDEIQRKKERLENKINQEIESFQNRNNNLRNERSEFINEKYDMIREQSNFKSLLNQENQNIKNQNGRIKSKSKDKKQETKTLKNLIKDILKSKNEVISCKHEILANKRRMSDIKFEVQVAKINDKISDEKIQYNMLTEAIEDKNFKEEFNYSEFYKNRKNQLSFWNERKIKNQKHKIIKDENISFKLKLNRTEKSLGLKNHISLICKNQSLKNHYLDQSINKNTIVGETINFENIFNNSLLFENQAEGKYGNTVAISENFNTKKKQFTDSKAEENRKA